MRSGALQNPELLDIPIKYEVYPHEAVEMPHQNSGKSCHLRAHISTAILVYRRAIEEKAGAMINLIANFSCLHLHLAERG